MKRQILMSILIIGVTSMLMGTGTYACFHNRWTYIRPNPSNSSNLIDIRDQDERWGHDVTATWTADDMKPGDNFPFHRRFVGLKKHRGSSPADHIDITCDYIVIDDDDTEADTNWDTENDPDSMAKQMIITRCKYLGWGSSNYINCLTNSNPDWRIEHMDDDGKITFYDFKLDPLKNLPAPEKWWSRDWFKLGVKFDENAGNDFQGDTFDLTVSFIATLE